MEAHILNVNSVSEMEWVRVRFSVHAFIKGSIPSDYIWCEQEDTRIDTNGELFYAVVLDPEGKR